MFLRATIALLCAFGALTEPLRCFEREEIGYDLPFQINDENGHALSLYLYEPPYAQPLIDHVIGCVDRIFETRKSDAELPWNNQHDMVDQYSYDLRAYYRLKAYPHLVDDPEDADLVVVNWLITSDLFMSAAYPECPTRGMAVMEQLSADEVIHKYIDKLILFMDGYRPRIKYREDVTKLKLVIESSIAIGQDHFHGPLPHPGRYVTTPHSITPSLRDQFRCAVTTNKTRSLNAYFSGGYRHRLGATLRPGLAKQDWKSINSIFNLITKHVEHYGRGSPEQKALEKTYVEATTAARFRIVVAGDCPNTRGLWDAMLGGSVPIIVTNGWVPFLPFPDVIDWRSLVIVVDSSMDYDAIFHRIANVMEQFDDQHARERLASLWPYFVWGWGPPSPRWKSSHHVAGDGGVGLVTDLALSAAARLARGRKQRPVLTDYDRLKAKPAVPPE